MHRTVKVTDVKYLSEVYKSNDKVGLHTKIQQITMRTDGATAVPRTAHTLLPLHAAHSLERVIEVVVVVRDLRQKKR